MPSICSHCYVVPLKILFGCEIFVEWLCVVISTSCKKIVLAMLHTFDNGCVATLKFLVVLLCCVSFCVATPFL